MEKDDLKSLAKISGGLTEVFRKYIVLEMSKHRFYLDDKWFFSPYLIIERSPANWVGEFPSAYYYTAKFFSDEKMEYEYLHLDCVNFAELFNYAAGLHAIFMSSINVCPKEIEYWENIQRIGFFKSLEIA